MYTAQSKKMLILNILRILEKYSDEDNPLSQQKIKEILEREYSMTVERKAIKRNLMDLMDFGYNLAYSETTRVNKNGEEETIYSDWYLIRDFQDSELRLLIDSLLFSKYIPYSQCRDLIKKLEGLSGMRFNSRVRHISKMPVDSAVNKQLFYTIDILDEAITKGKKVDFYFTEYGTDKVLYPCKDKSGQPKRYKVSPYQMVVANGRYYLICSHDGSTKLYHYRLDRITDIKLSDEFATPVERLDGMENGLDLSKHISEHLYMFGGESVRVTFRVKRSAIGNIIDWFGRDVSFSNTECDEVTASAFVNRRAMFYWALQFGENTEVLTPIELREEIQNAVRAMAEKYNKNL